MLSIFSYACWASVYLLWRNVCSCLLPIFQLDCWLFLLLSCISCLSILEMRPLSVASFETIFSHCESCLCVFLLVSFAVQKLASLIRSHWFIFALISVALGDGPEKHFFFFNFPTVQQGGQVILTCMHCSFKYLCSYIKNMSQISHLNWHLN